MKSFPPLELGQGVTKGATSSCKDKQLLFITGSGLELVEKQKKEISQA
jgi:hypothetical protein